MTGTAEKIMQLFRRHDKVKTGTVLTSAELSLMTRDWEPSDFAKLDEAIKELSREGYVIITPSKGLELTDEGYDYLFS